MTLVDNLRQAIDAEEARLHALPPFPWKLNPDDDTEVFAADDVVLAEAWALSTNQQRLVAEHIVAGSPERGLRRCAAHRKILDECVRTLEHEDYGHWLADRVLAGLAEAYGVEA